MSGLGDIVDVREKAVLQHCFHVFCVDCLNRWLPVKRLCPLCKVRATCLLNHWVRNLPQLIWCGAFDFTAYSGHACDRCHL